GLALWTLADGWLPLAGVGLAVWGLGFASTNSMQQARLVEAQPDLSSATIGLNTSTLYVGQAIGSALGGALFALGYIHALRFAAVGFLLLAIVVWATTRDPRTV